MNEYLTYLARRIGLCAAMAAVLGAAVPNFAASATANWPWLFSLPLIVAAYLPALIAASVAVPQVWDYLVRRLPGYPRTLPGVALIARRHFAPYDAPAREELRWAELARRPEVWAERAGVSGTGRVPVTTRYNDGTTTTRNKTMPTFPKCKAVFMTPTGPAARYTVAPSTTPGQWNAARVASALGRNAVQVKHDDAQTVTLSVVTRAPFTAPVPLPSTLPETWDTPPNVGLTAAGSPFRLPMFGRQTLLLGASGSGKGSVIWSVVSQLAPAVATGEVELWGIDLKGGVELAPARPLFARLAYTFDEAFELLSDASAVLNRRLEFMRQNGVRKHTPFAGAEPAVLLLIDEAASLSLLAPDRKSADAITALLKRITTTGRAAGVSVLAAMQDPRKENLPARDTFTHVLALRLRTKEDTVLALGQAAWDAGARCETISTDQPGAGYVLDTETGDLVHFRASWVSDDDIRALAARFPGDSANPKGRC